MLEFFFWLLFASICWTYIGYPILLVIISKFYHHSIKHEPIEPTITLIITVYNEERAIGDKLTNSLNINYPREKLQILVSSDCSNDKTHEIVESFADQGVELTILRERGGKTVAENAAAAIARGEILVFTDATTEVTPNTLRDLVQKFADERVGCIGAELEYVSDKGTAVGRGAGAYWRYEKWLKKMEASINSLIGVSGCLYAVRRVLYSELAPDMISDFVIASEVYSKGHITVYGSGAVSKEKTLENPRQEFDMRVRVAIGSINALFRYSQMLNPFRYGFFSFQLFSHKVLRYLVPEFLISLLAINIFLVIGESAHIWFYQILLILHLAVYVAALLGWLAHSRGIKIPGIHIPFYFMQVNVAAFWALICYIQGERKTTWIPIR